LEVARSEIGSNRKHRGNRFLTVIQYCLDMTDALRELWRVCMEGARIIQVVGRESNVRKTPFYNGEIVASLGAYCADLTPLVRQERVFKNKFGTLIYEDILHYEKRGRCGEGATTPLDIARSALVDAMTRVPDESRVDLELALEGATEVRRSPIYAAPRTTSGRAGEDRSWCQCSQPLTSRS
jgi:hypothetical protein